MQPSAMCDACGSEVRGDDAVTQEVTAGELMCPTTMVFHRSCHEQAAGMWQPHPDACDARGWVQANVDDEPGW